MFHVFGDHSEESRLTRVAAGASHPLWYPFLFAASLGVGYWMLTNWTRRSLAAELPGAAVGLGAAAGAGQPQFRPEAEPSGPSPANAEPDLDASRLDRPEQAMAHNPLPAEAPTDALDTAPDPVVPPEHVMDHAPASTVNAPANPEVERRLAQAQAVSGEEPGGRAALLAETSAAVLGETASFGGDQRGDDEAGSTSALDAVDEDAADMLDAAYAANLGPVLTPGGGKKKSKKARTVPGTPPGL